MTIGRIIFSYLHYSALSNYYFHIFNLCYPGCFLFLFNQKKRSVEWKRSALCATDCTKRKLAVIVCMKWINLFHRIIFTEARVSSAKDLPIIVNITGNIHQGRIKWEYFPNFQRIYSSSSSGNTYNKIFCLLNAELFPLRCLVFDDN